MAIDLFSVSNFDATFTHLSRCKVSQISGAATLNEPGTHSLQCILIDTFIAKRFQFCPVKRRFARAWTSTQKNDIQTFLLLCDDWDYGL